MESTAVPMQSRFLWTRFVMFAIGFWLMVTPGTFAQHSRLVTHNDVVCGILIMVLSLLALSLQRRWVLWALFAIGVWLQLAPLLFWAPNAVAYLNDTACGALLILLSIIVPGTPGGVEAKGGEIPPGWSYNPSSWHQRLPVILFAFLAWMAARYMAAYQLGYIDQIWDPIFKNGTQKVITSPLSKSFPIPDAGLGALVYSLEVLMGFKGSTRRWYTMPWIVLLFGIMVVPAGLISILLIMLQPLIVGHWCMWCLLTAVCMLLMIALTLDEVVAVCQYLKTVIKEKSGFWRTFWKGGTYPEGKVDMRSPSLHSSWKKHGKAMVLGVTLPWNLLLTILLGIVLMFTPAFLRVNAYQATNNYIVGALVATISFVALAEVTRLARLCNVVLGVWVITHALFFIRQPNGHTLYHIVWGLLLIVLSLPRGKIKESYGTWNSYIR